MAVKTPKPQSRDSGHLFVDVGGVLVPKRLFREIDEKLVREGFMTPEDAKGVLEALKERDQKTVREITRRVWSEAGLLSHEARQAIGSGIARRVVQREPKIGERILVDVFRQHIPGVNDVVDAFNYFRQKTNRKVFIHTSQPPEMAEIFRRAVGADGIVRKFTPEARRGIVIDDFDLLPKGEYVKVVGEDISRSEKRRLTPPARWLRVVPREHYRSEQEHFDQWVRLKSDASFQHPRVRQAGVDALHLSLPQAIRYAADNHGRLMKVSVPPSFFRPRKKPRKLSK